jgi:branched-chain amino acid transport system permease protein
MGLHAGVVLQSGGPIADVLRAVESVGVPVQLLLQFADRFAFIVLAAIGLAIIFGMMGVINLAHGEFIMIGAYGTTLTANATGMPLPAAILVGALVTAAFGFAVERTIVQWLYDRLFDSMVATFGLGLILVEGVRYYFGDSLPSVGTPFGAVPGYTYPAYRVFLAAIAVALLVAAYLVFTRTKFGIRARATIQDPETARAMGVDTDRMNTATFVIGSGLAGLTGGLYAPSIPIQPGMGESFLIESFVAVVVGGGSVLVGTVLSGGLLGSVSAAVSFAYTTFWGQIAMLVTAILIIRLLPDGLTGLLDSVRDRLGVSDFGS